MARIDSFLELVVDQHASDLHFHAGNPPIIRHLNRLVPIPFRALSDGETRRFLFEILTPEQQTELDEKHEIDALYDLPGVARFRLNAFHQSHGIGAVFRIVPNRVPSLDDLDFPLAVRKLTELQNGLILVTGPTGSGKTTTLAALVNEMNKTQKRHIITLEDPIEYIHTPLQSKVAQRQVGRHTDSFPSALRSALRESPDVLVIGEMRDPETMMLALQATETGSLVIGTLHTSSAARATDRIIDAMPEDGRDQARVALSVLLRCVIGQQLCRSSDGETRTPLLEILFNNYAIANMIREGKTYQIESYLQTANPEETHQQSIDTCIIRAIREDRVDVEDAMRFARSPEAVKKAVAETQEDA